MNYIDRFVKQAEFMYRRNQKIVRAGQVILALLVIVSVVLLKNSYGEAKVTDQIQQEIANEIIRFHVLANSDLKEDQDVKLKVKDKVVTYMQGRLKDCTTKEEAKQILRNEQDNIKDIAIEELRRNGYSYSVRCELSKEYFPVKVYGDLTFPSGDYDAFRILIGNAEGKNWWCVMFPSLCLVNETYTVVPEDSKNKLKNVLSEDDYDAIDTAKVEYHFWLYDALSDLF